MTTTNDHVPGRQPAQYLALGVGAAYLLVGIVGFFLTGFSGFADSHGELLLGIFEINPLHNIVHVIIGAAGLALWSRLAGARVYGWLLTAGYGLTFLYGLFVAGSESGANFLALNAGDNVLHIASALVGLAIALWPARAAQTAESSAHAHTPQAAQQ